MDLGGVAIKGALERAGVGAEQVDYVIMGQVLQAGAGPDHRPPGRGRTAGIPMTRARDHHQQGVPLRHQRAVPRRPDDPGGDAEVVVAGGMESMTNAPYLLPKARAGYRMGNGELVDSLIHDGLWCAFDAVHMGAGTEKYVGQVGGITRELQDELAAKSHERAAAAKKEGRFADEIAPVSIPQRKGDPVVVDRTRACGPARPPSRSAGCGPRSRRTARSPPATRRRSPTAAPR